MKWEGGCDGAAEKGVTEEEEEAAAQGLTEWAAENDGDADAAADEVGKEARRVESKNSIYKIRKVYSSQFLRRLIILLFIVYIRQIEKI